MADFKQVSVCETQIDCVTQQLASKFTTRNISIADFHKNVQDFLDVLKDEVGPWASLVQAMINYE